MIAPSVPFSTWILAAFDPILIVAATYLGWKADQAGKVFIAAIAAIGITLVIEAVITWIGIPSLAPVSREGPMLLPVRSVAALIWAGLGYGAHRLYERRR
ncbi:hypothetical protein [Enterovirga rhinocerotis]|uniref:Uncharacterized protein n=1 Tax=Enterovirga rhinocerotis TaxID=1339210 RepID=A0A4R7C885_9HYPH|nr:hypothetical protein EV668_1720 [Enterovirga rhinocerotis]